MVAGPSSPSATQGRVEAQVGQLVHDRLHARRPGLPPRRGGRPTGALLAPPPTDVRARPASSAASAASSASRWASSRNPAGSKPERRRLGTAAQRCCGRPTEPWRSRGHDQQADLAHLLQVEAHRVRVQVQALGDLGGRQRILGAGDLLVDGVAGRSASTLKRDSRSTRSSLPTPVD